MVEQHGKTLVPQIRFAGFTDPWEQRKLGELFEESDERASDREILSVSVANGIYPASESDRETNPGASLANYKIVHSGDVVYNSMRMWQGAVDASRYGGIVSPAYVVARPNSEVYARFFARLLRQPMLLKQYQQVSQGNSKDTQVLKFDDFASIGISMPASENEQRRIGAFFDRLDSLITLHQRKYDKLCVLKKSMLDKMFPKGGSLYPEIRFAGFTDPWEQRKLGELCSFSKGCGYSKNNLRDQGTPIILYGRLYTNYETQIHSVDTFVDPLENSVYTEGGEVIVPASGETAEDISIASVVEKPGIILGGDLNIITPSAVVNPVFLALELSYGKPHFDLAKRAQGKSVVHIHNEDIANVFFDRPCIAEQRRIGEFFDRLDTLITLHQRKLELLRNIKKSMLDKMFV
ncbi:restriction endonuclease subunit S [Bifidobacterium pseudocatenulatum]|uniref:restriction endonuclease subunit S n=3 Tax=Bifidobacterium pseudocatenulatum TaxID=28026 RepID=UPI00115A10F7|nr:restriction endonuclease subunit S [Bifidobacterium pseudocatenulatum]GEA41150.1 HsdS specificity protein of type I restriction-modification system [Bifidobacterium pseudocatenulatum]